MLNLGYITYLSALVSVSLPRTSPVKCNGLWLGGSSISASNMDEEGIARDRVAKFKRPRILGDQKISENNQKLRPLQDYQIFVKELTQRFSFQQIFQVMFLLPTETAV